MSAVGTGPVQCWCGANDLGPFSAEYLRCARCETLVNSRPFRAADFQVDESEQGIYGREYYAVTLPKKYGFPPIEDRARQDLTERCLHWLTTIVRYRLPPADILELGSAHGAFVALLELAGYRATGLELSPWLVNFARDTFGIPMLAGPVEHQTIAPESLDVIAMFDVIEHLPAPQQTLKRCLDLLKPEGLLVIQTPRYPAGMDYAAMLQTNDPFKAHLKPEQHLFLFSPPSITEFLRRLGVRHLRFETAVFALYDMYLVASRKPFEPIDEERISAALTASPRRRFALAMLDLRRREVDLKVVSDRVQADNGALRQRMDEIEADRDARLNVILDQQEQNAALQQRIDEIEADREARLKLILDLQAENAALRQRMDEIEADREARLKVILDQQAENAALRQRMDEIEADREARLKLILDQQAENAALRQRMDEIEADREARLKVILDQQAENAALRQRIEEIETDRDARSKLIQDKLEQRDYTIHESEIEIARLQTFRGALRALLKAGGLH